MEKRTQAGDSDATLLAKHHGLMLEHRELGLGLQRVGLPHRAGRVLGQGNSPELAHQPHQLAVRLRATAHSVVVVVGVANVPQQVEPRGHQIARRDIAFGGSRSTAQPALTEEWVALTDSDPVRGIHRPAAEALRRHHGIEHRIFERAGPVCAGPGCSPSLTHCRQRWIALERRALHPPQAQRRVLRKRVR